MKKALCAYYPNPDDFFPGRGQTIRAAKAKAVCEKCPVIQQCRQHKIDTGSTDGIWGGESNKRK